MADVDPIRSQLGHHTARRSSAAPAAPPPRKSTEITAEWLTSALSTTYEGIEVTGLEIVEINKGTSTRARLRAEYNDVGERLGMPSGLFLKGSFENDFRDMFTASGIYEKECRFYTELRPRLAVPTPGFHYANIDESDGQFVLIIDDLAAAGATFGRASEPLTPVAVDAVLRHMASLHARFWASDELESMEWITSPVDGPQEESTRLFAQFGIQLLLDGAHGFAVPEVLRNPDALEAAFWKLMRFDDRPPRTVCHGDPHPANIAFFSETEPVFADWQVLRKGLWAHDVSYFLVTALSVEDRRLHEQDLLRAYLDVLSAHGVDAPTFDTAWDVYRAQPVYGLLVWVATPAEMQPPEVSGPYIERLLAAVDDLDTMGAIAALGTDEAGEAASRRLT